MAAAMKDICDRNSISTASAGTFIYLLLGLPGNEALEGNVTLEVLLVSIEAVE